MARAMRMHSFAREATFVSDIAQLSDTDIARATGVAPSTARAWLAGTRSPTGERAERLVELSSLVERLVRVIDPAYVAVWLRKPVPALDEEKPIDVIRRGEYRRVARLISELEEMPVT
jgi:transcriptional regulator with XRE-family HTH domain